MSSAAPRSRKMGLLIASEGSSPGVDPSTDGSGYTRVPAENVSATEETEILETAYVTDRNFPSESEVGAGGSSMTFDTPLIGMAAAAGDGVNASTVTDDWLDIMLTHAFGAQTTTAGEGVTAVPSSTSITPATDVYGVHDLLPIYETGVPSAIAARTQWGSVISEAAGTHTFDPPLRNFGTVPPTSAAVIYGAKTYRPTDAGGNELSAVQVSDAEIYTHTMGRVNSLKIAAQHKGRVMCSWGMQFDASSPDDASAKTALPAAARLTTTPIKFLLSPAYFNGARIDTKSIDIDFGVAAMEVEDSEGANGRGGNELVSVAPIITLEPMHQEAYRQYKRAGTKGRLIVQLGGGVLSGGVLNSVCCQFELCEAREVTVSDDAGRKRQALRFHAVDRIELSSGVPSIFMQLARA